MTTTSTVAEVRSFDFGKSFEDIHAKMCERFQTLLTKDTVLYRVNVPRNIIWRRYLSLILDKGGAAAHNHFNCSTCRKMVEQFGNVVTIYEDGTIVPVMWGDYTDELDSPLAKVHASLNDSVSKQKIESLWYSKESFIGTPCNQAEDGSIWTHMAVDIPAHLYKASDASVFIAESKDRFRTLMAEETGIHQIPLSVIGTAIKFFKDNELNRSEKFIAAAQFHYNIRESLSDPEKKKGLNSLLWRQLGHSPKGWENVNSTMVGQLYSWIAQGIDLYEIKRRWNERVEGINYQRAKVAPSEQTIKQAEELIAKLGIEPALHRRFARIEEIDCFWKPTAVVEPETQTGGVFSKIKPKNSSTVVREYEYESTPKTVTWEKFVEKILPEVTSMRFKVPHHGNFCAMTTQTHENAPPIMKWDNEEKRYPISNYVYHNGSHSSQWGLVGESLYTVTGITSIPSVEEAYVLLLEGCVDSNTKQGIALFPDNIKSELHGVRSVIEAYSNSEQLAGQEEATACGFQVANNGFGITIEVTTPEGKSKYFIDRLD